MMEITILGGGGHCFALVELIRSMEQYDIVAILDKNPSTSEVLGVPVQLRDHQDLTGKTIAIAIGNNTIRKKIVASSHFESPNFVHNSAVVYPSARLGKGVQVLPNAVIDTAVAIGDFSIVNTNATISHNTIVGNYCHIAINAAVSGGCRIGEGVLIGAGSVVLPEISIGDWVTVGAGAVVTKDIPSGATVVGNPAKIIK